MHKRIYQKISALSPLEFPAKRLSQTVLIVTALLGFSTTLTVRADYFLHASQRSELILTGQITGEDQVLYQVWIVPGYLPPLHDATLHWGNAGNRMRDYGDPQFYRSIAQHTHHILEFDQHQVFGEFLVHGIRNDWVDALKTAQERTQRRVFGWWLAYPWAFVELSTETALRSVAGTSAGIVIGVLGPTLWPVTEWLLPSVEAGYNVLLPGSIIPLLQLSWNTLVAPPLALLGEQPSATRADGFWIQALPTQATDKQLTELQAVLAQETQNILSSPELQSLEQERQQIDAQYTSERQRLLQHLQDEQASAEQQNTNKQQQWLDTLLNEQPQLCHPDLLRQVLQHRHSADDILQPLNTNTTVGSLTPQLIHHCIEILQSSPAKVVVPVPPPPGNTPANGG